MTDLTGERAPGDVDGALGGGGKEQIPLPIGSLLNGDVIGGGHGFKCILVKDRYAGQGSTPHGLKYFDWLAKLPKLRLPACLCHQLKG